MLFEPKVITNGIGEEDVQVSLTLSAFITGYVSYES